MSKGPPGWPVSTPLSTCRSASRMGWRHGRAPRAEAALGALVTPLCCVCLLIAVVAPQWPVHAFWACVGWLACMIRHTCVTFMRCG